MLGDAHYNFTQLAFEKIWNMKNVEWTIIYATPLGSHNIENRQTQHPSIIQGILTFVVDEKTKYDERTTETI